MLIDRIASDVKTAMKTGQALRVSVLRMALSEANYRKIELQRELTDEDMTAVVAREVKKRREAIEAYRAANREDQAKKEEEEMAILQVYLPAQMGELEIRNEILEMRELDGVADFGQAMRIAAPRFKGRADGSLVAKVVHEKIK